MKCQHWCVTVFLFTLLINSPVRAQRRLIDSLRVSLTKKLPDTTRANTYYDIANAFYKQTNYDSAHAYLDRMPTYCRRVNYRLGLGHYNRLKGIMYTQQGRFDDAMRQLHAAADQFAKANKEKLVARTYSSLGLLYKTMGQDNQRVDALLKQGIAYLNKAIAINQRLNLPDQLVDNYVNLGITYEDMHEYDLGRDCFLKALAINDETKAYEDAYRVIYNDLGKNYNVRGEYETAIGYLNKSLAINLKNNRISSLVHNYRNLATSYRGLKQFPKAVEYGEKARQLVEQSKNTTLAQSVYRGLSASYAAAGQYEKAYQYLLKGKSLEDSLMNIQKAEVIAQIQALYDTRKATEVAEVGARMQLDKAREIARIEAEKALEITSIQASERTRLADLRADADVEKTRAVAEVEAKYENQKRQQRLLELDALTHLQTRQVNYMSGGLGILVVLLGLLVYQYRAIRLANRRLSIQNKVISTKSTLLAEQADQLRTLMKELHHRVKNNLAIVSGLLTLQANGLEDENMAQAVRIGQQRVEAMSLIHQRLYQTDRVTVINMNEYLTDLAVSLMRAYGYQANEFDLRMDITQQELDVDVAIPLGLIVNELVTNAFKYAYNTGKRPFLRISLLKADQSARPTITLEVQDNGPGIEELDWQRRTTRTSFGKRLITSLTEQLEGKLELYKMNGALFRLYIPQSRLN
ncbi:tetratricopeptide repeat protein [Spirosoma sp. KUDC1026]|nr:tetratricopeptide repeat protein [Spirosoma sp. KUDC1026]